MHSEPRQ